MKPLQRTSRVLSRLFFPGLLLFALAAPSLAQETARTPLSLVNSLSARMYVIGKLSGDVSEMIAAEKYVAAEIAAYVRRGVEPEKLVEKTPLHGVADMSPLKLAAINGYADVVEALLKSDLVKTGLEEPDQAGLTAWSYANRAMNQALWACVPKEKLESRELLGAAVIQPYYMRPGENPYRKTRRLLEKAGAKADQEGARRDALTLCGNGDDALRVRLQKSQDVQKILLEAGEKAYGTWKANRARTMRK